MNNKITIGILMVIIILSSILRFYNLGSVPPSISWDEAAVGYNSWTIIHHAQDEWSKILPLYFKSFEDDKHPVHIYLTALSVAILGLSDFSIRFMPASLGILNVILIFFLSRYIFKNEKIGLISAFFLAISPINIIFSRFNHEANFTLFFFLLGLVSFYKCLEKKSARWFIGSLISLGVSLISYQAALIVTPLIILPLLFFYRKEILEIPYTKMSLILATGVIGIVFYLNQPLFGFSRIHQTQFSEDRVKNNFLYEMSNNLFLGNLGLTLERYIAFFSPEYLFIKGDPNPKFSIQTFGQFYYLDGLFLLIGLISILVKPDKAGLILLIWALVAPIPASIVGGVNESPHSGRGLFIMGSWNMISAYGCYQILKLLKNNTLKGLYLSLVILLFGYLLWSFTKIYYGNYNKDYAIEWQYGMAQIANFIKLHTGYREVYMTDIRSQPYIFLLNYLKVPLSEFSKSVKYNNSPSRSYNLVSEFSLPIEDDGVIKTNKYHFGDWNPIESRPTPGVLYVLSSSQYDGLRYKSEFKVKEIVWYPNKTVAFYLVSLY